MNTNLRLVVDNTAGADRLPAAVRVVDVAPAGPGTLAQTVGMLMVLGRFAAVVSRAALLPFVLLGAAARLGLRLARGLLRGFLGLVCLVFVVALVVVAVKAVGVMATKPHGATATLGSVASANPGRV